MRINPVTVILIAVFLYPIVKGFLFKFSSRSLKNSIQEIESNLCFIASLFIGVYLSKKIFMEHDKGIYIKIYQAIPNNITDYIEQNSIIFYVVIVPVLIFCSYKIIRLVLEGINLVTFYPMADILERFMENKSTLFKRITGCIFQLPRSIGYVLFITFLINILSIINVGNKYDVYLESSKLYSFLCKEVVIPVTNSSVAKQLPNIIDNSFRVVVKDEDNNQTAKANETPSNRKIVVYYNGVTLDEGIKSNAKIDSKAKEIASRGTTSKDKARLLYNWIGNYVDYDNDKANEVLNGDFEIKSGAIPTFNTRKGICFDYACLYVAMARANGLKVRIITGEGFNGVGWVSHAWNQVYIPEENKWINVDTTFYKGGNYFNSKRFDLDHRNSKIAGEW